MGAPRRRTDPADRRILSGRALVADHNL